MFDFVTVAEKSEKMDFAEQAIRLMKSSAENMNEAAILLAKAEMDVNTSFIEAVGNIMVALGDTYKEIANMVE